MNRTVFHKALIACLLISSTTGCLPAPTETPEATLARSTPTQEKPTPVIEGTPLPFETIEKSQYGGGVPGGLSTKDQPRLDVYQQTADIPAIEAIISQNALEILRQLDFQSHIAVGVFQGWKPSSGYGVDIVTVARMGMRISIYAELIEPEPGIVVSDVMTAPYQLIKLDREGLSGSRIFELIVEETTIQQVEVTID